jgi:hypothetical protein
VNSTIINQTISGNMSTGIFSYLQEMPKSIAAGNATAIIISLVVFFIAVIIVNALSKLLLSFLKKTILFFIIILVIYDLFPQYLNLIEVYGWTFSNIVIGIIAIAACGIGFYMTLRSFVRGAKHHIKAFSYKFRNKDKEHEELIRKKEAEILETRKQSESLKEGISKEALGNEKSLLAVLVYLVVAQFGVFSSPTLSAPNVQVGMMFFILFLVGIIIFTKSSYKTTKIAITYFSVIFIVALLLSFTLGILWGKNTLAQLLSPEFFTSDSLVAMITGMGVSLFAGSKS